MSLFSLDNILLNESNTETSVNIDSIGYLDNDLKNHSFVQEGYNFILELGRDYMDAEKTFYTNVLGSYGDNEIITESFSGFFDKIKAAIHKFIEWIKKVFKQFVVKINALFSNEKYIKKNHKLLYKFDSTDEFEFNGYEFTNVDKVDVPKAAALEAFEKSDYGTNFTDFTTIKATFGTGSTDVNPNNSNNLATNTTKFNDEMDKKITSLNDGINDFYDEFRGKVIGKAEKFDSSEFSEALFELFRNGDDKPSDITIDATYVSDAYRRFESHKDLIKSIEKTQKSMIHDYEALEKHIDKMISLNKETGKYSRLSIKSTSGNTYTGDQLNKMGVSDLNDMNISDTSSFDKLNNYYKIQATKINTMCTIHTQAFSAKLEAAKDCFKQDKKILYKALSQITKRSNKEGF